MAKIIAVMNEKGGTGKSATATTLAYLLAKKGKKTALIDNDMPLAAFLLSMLDERCRQHQECKFRRPIYGSALPPF